MTYTPYAPTALSNGTTIIEVQCDFAAAAIEKMLKEADDSQDNKNKTTTTTTTGRTIKAIEALPEAEDAWARYVERQNEGTLFPLTESWWTGANIPGKKAQLLTYLNGMAMYESDIRTRLDQWEGFEVRYSDGTKVQKRPQQTASGQTEEEEEKKKTKEVPLSEHVEYREGTGKGASEAADILRPAVAAT